MVLYFHYFVIVCLIAISTDFIVSAFRPVFYVQAVSRDDANRACHNKTFDFLSEDDINRKNLTSSVLSAMKPGDTAWIRSVANFSKYVSLLGCWEVNKRLNTLRYNDIIDNNVFQCAINCGSRYPYFGMKWDTCYCLRSLPQSQPSSNCDIKCNSFSEEMCGGNDTASVYKSVQSHDIGVVRLNKSEQHGLCVTVKKGTDNVVQWTTRSCRQYCSNCYIICDRCYTSDVVTATNESCYTHLNTNEHNTWENAIKECSKIQSIPFNPEKADIAILNIMGTNENYWTGVFRTFNPNSVSQPLSTDACIYVRKTAKTLQYDTADCSSEKAILCLDRMVYTDPIISSGLSTASQTNTPTTQYTSTTLMVSTTSLANVSNANTKDEQSKESDANTKDEQSIVTGANTDGDPSAARINLIVVVSVVAVTVLVVVIVTLIFCKKKRDKKMIENVKSPETGPPGGENTQGITEAGVAEKQDSNHSTYDTDVGCTATPCTLQYDSIVLDNQYADIENAGLNVGSSSIIQNKSPRKPERKSLKAKQGLLVQGEHSVGPNIDDPPENTYNVASCFPKSTPESENLNIYDHTIIGGDASASNTKTVEEEDVYDQAGHPGKAATMTKTGDGEMNPYSCTSDTACHQVADDDIYNHTCDKNDKTRPDSTYNQLQLNNKC